MGRPRNRDGARCVHYSQSHERSAAAPRLDHRHLRRRRGQGRVLGAAYGRIPRPRGSDLAERPAPLVRACPHQAGRSVRYRRHREGCRRRSGCDSWRAGARHRAQRSAERRHRVSGGRRRGHRHAARLADPAGGARDQSRAAADDPRRNRASGGCGGRARSRGGDRHSGRRGAGGAHAQRATRHHRRAFDPGYDRNHHPVFLLGLDSFDSSRHRRGASERHRPRRCLDRIDVRSRRAKAL